MLNVKFESQELSILVVIPYLPCPNAAATGVQQACDGWCCNCLYLVVHAQVLLHCFVRVVQHTVFRPSRLTSDYYLNS